MQAPGKCDTMIIGGGVVGMATAYFLKTLAPEMDVAVIEREPDYEHCSTLRASGGCRVQFSCPENIRMSLFSMEFIRRFPQLVATATHEAPIDWVEGGYLFVVPPEHVSLLEANHAIQRQHGCDADLLDAAALLGPVPVDAGGRPRRGRPHPTRWLVRPVPDAARPAPEGDRLGR